jgi:hypothetical protein
MVTTISFDYTLSKKKTEEFMKIGTAKIDYKASRMYAKFENLFNGDKALSKFSHYPRSIMRNSHCPHSLSTG